MPPKAFLRLFSDRGEFAPAEFYDSSAFLSTDTTQWRQSEVAQVTDQLDLAGISITGSKILDISGGPGYVAKSLQQLGADVVVTEYSRTMVDAMQKNLSLTAVDFDYAKDDIAEKVVGCFDVILVRSSIIFCPDLKKFAGQLKKLLKPSGLLLIESILPTYGEIFWWQQLEYKFPVIYSQETIEKTFYKTGFKLKLCYKDTGGYTGVKYRSYKNFSRQLFTWLIEFPMVIFYYLINIYKKTSIDSSFNHKMVTQVWALESVDGARYLNYTQGAVNKSKTFGYTYNGYLKWKR
jgi:2-polyprenyl-3-methyl-5-hydroxy-6-metoxy-1,4-benzoquinol methylase